MYGTNRWISRATDLQLSALCMATSNTQLQGMGSSASARAMPLMTGKGEAFWGVLWTKARSVPWRDVCILWSTIAMQFIHTYIYRLTTYNAPECYTITTIAGLLEYQKAICPISCMICSPQADRINQRSKCL